MRCQQIQEMFSACLDGELSPSKEALVKTHLISCAACRARWEELQSTVALVRNLPELSPPPEFRSKVRQRLAVLPAPVNILPPARTRFLSRLIRRRGLISAAAALILVLGTASLLWSGDLPGRLGNGHNRVKQNSQLADVNQTGNDPLKTEKTGQPATGQKREPVSLNRREFSADGGANTSSAAGGARIEGNYTATAQEQVGNAAPASSAIKGNDKKTAFMALFVQPPVHFSGSDLSSRGTELAGTRHTPGGAGATEPARETAPVGTGCGNAGGPTGTAALSDTTGLSRPAETVRQADISLQVGDREGAKKEINLLAQRYNGMINPDPDGNTFTVVLPVNSLEPFMAKLKLLGRASGEKVEERDVSKEYYDALGRLSVLQNELAGLQSPGSGSGQKTGDTQNAGAANQQPAETKGAANQQLRTEINCLKGKIQGLEDAISRATVKITLN